MTMVGCGGWCRERGMVGFGGGIVVWEWCLLLVFCLIFVRLFIFILWSILVALVCLVGGTSEFMVVSIALFTWCFVVVCG